MDDKKNNSSLDQNNLANNSSQISGNSSVSETQSESVNPSVQTSTQNNSNQQQNNKQNSNTVKNVQQTPSQSGSPVHQKDLKDTNKPINNTPQPQTQSSKETSRLQTSNRQPSSEDPSSVITTKQSDSGGNFGGKKAIATIFGVLLLILGVGTGVYLVQNQQIIPAGAWNCRLYTFEVGKDGVVTVKNGSTRDEPSQRAEVYINNQLIDTLEVPALNSGDATTLGNVEVPEDDFTWRVKGTSDCENEGTIEQLTETISCPIEPNENRKVIIIHETTENQLRSDRNTLSKIGPLSADIPIGTYRVTLVAYDNHSEHKRTQNQPNEIWYLETDSAGNTDSTSDIPDNEDWKIEVVNDEFNVDSPINSVTAVHTAYPDNSSANSVSPVCAAFESIEQVPTPTDIQSPTPTPSPPPELTAQCSNVTAYDTEWNVLTNNDLTSLSPGDIVRFTVSGTANRGSFNKAKFTVNNISLGETTTKKPDSDEFYIEYTVPEGVNSFAVDGKVHHTELGWF